MPQMDIHQVLEYLPHRYPFLLIDRVLEFSPGESLVALKNVTYNEQFFQGHFPKRPVMPAVLILEAMAQATAVFALRSLESVPTSDSIYYFVGIDKARFRRPVEPGDTLLINVRHRKNARGIWKVDCDVKVGDAGVAEAELMGALRELDS